MQRLRSLLHLLVEIVVKKGPGVLGLDLNHVFSRNFDLFSIRSKFRSLSAYSMLVSDVVILFPLWLVIINFAFCEILCG